MTQPHDWRDRIRIDPAVHHGDPCIAGTRIPVSIIVGSIADGDTWDQVLSSYPALQREDIQAALLYAAEAVNDSSCSRPMIERLHGCPRQSG